MVCLLVVHSLFLMICSFLVQPFPISVLVIFFFSSLVALMVVVFLQFVMEVYSFLILIHFPLLFPILPFHGVNNWPLFLSVRKYNAKKKPFDA